MCASSAEMQRWLRGVRNDNAKGEYYLTDIVALARADGRHVTTVEAPADELAGINSQEELSCAEAVLQGWMRKAAQEAGVTMIDPSSVFLSADTKLSPDVTIEPNVFFGPGVSIASNVVIRAFSHIEGATIGSGSVIGPFARLRPGARLDQDVHVGNFVEIKASHLASGVKANHLSYIGDAICWNSALILVPARSHATMMVLRQASHDYRCACLSLVRTWLWLRLFRLVMVQVPSLSPGSVITENVEADALALARSRQVQKPGRAIT